MARASQPNDGRIRGIFEVRRVDETELPKAAIHEYRVRPRPAGEEAHALQQVAIGYAGRDEAHVLSARQVFRAVHAAVVDDPHPPGAFALLVVAEFEAPEDLGAEALQRRRRKDTFGRAADPHDREDGRASA